MLPNSEDSIPYTSLYRLLFTHPDISTLLVERDDESRRRLLFAISSQRGCYDVARRVLKQSTTHTLASGVHRRPIKHMLLAIYVNARYMYRELLIVVVATRAPVRCHRPHMLIVP